MRHVQPRCGVLPGRSVSTAFGCGTVQQWEVRQGGCALGWGISEFPLVCEVTIVTAPGLNLLFEGAGMGWTSWLVGKGWLGMQRTRWCHPTMATICLTLSLRSHPVVPSSWTERRKPAEFDGKLAREAYLVQWYSCLALGYASRGSRVRIPVIRWPLFMLWYHRWVAKDYPNCYHTVLRWDLQCYMHLRL